MKKLLARVISAIESSPTSFGLFLGAFSSLILARILIELWLFGFKTHSGVFLWYEWTHNFLFFLLSFVLFLPIVRRFARVSLPVASNVLLFGFLVILLPPVIDFVVSGGEGLWSFYIFDGLSGLFLRFFTFFGDRPDMGITYGVRVEVAMVVISFGAYVFWKTKRLFRALGASLSAYALLFFLGTFPSWAAIPILGLSEGNWFLRATDVAGVFLSPFAFFSRDLVDPRSILNAKMSLVYAGILPFVVGAWLFSEKRAVFLALFRNARFPQVVYHGGLLLVGMGLGIVFGKATIPSGFFDILSIFLLLGAVVCAWLASVVPNDVFDQAIDRETNPTRPLPASAIPLSTYWAIGGAFFVASLILSALVFPKGALLLLVYQVLAWAYSSPPFRLKRFPVVASFISAIASVLVLFVGFMSLSPGGTLAELPLSFVALFLFAYTVALPLKDFKDIAGDAKDDVWTLPVVLGAERAKLAIASGIFLSFLASVSVFRAPGLFVPALLLGSASFWAVVSMKQKTGRITYRSVFWLILGLVALYGAVVVWFGTSR